MNSSFSHRHSFDSADRSGLLEAELAQAIKRVGLIPPLENHALSRPQTWRKRWAIALLHFLTDPPQIAIRPSYISGALQWTVYDPNTDTLKQFGSEQAVRVWLEQRNA